jgi:hypothetical protein
MSLWEHLIVTGILHHGIGHIELADKITGDAPDILERNTAHRLAGSRSGHLLKRLSHLVRQDGVPDKSGMNPVEREEAADLAPSNWTSRQAAANAFSYPPPTRTRDTGDP